MSGDGERVKGGDGVLVPGGDGKGKGLGRVAKKSSNKFLPLPTALLWKVANADPSDGIRGGGGAYGGDLTPAALLGVAKLDGGDGAGLLGRGHTSPRIPRSKSPFKVGEEGKGHSGNAN